MEPIEMIERLSRGDSVKFPHNANTLEYAQELDGQERFRSFREQFRIPTKSSLKRKAIVPGQVQRLDRSGHETSVINGKTTANGVNGAHEDWKNDTECIYFCGNSLGCQPKLVSQYLQTHLQTWAEHGVNGHFTDFEGSPLTAWQDMAESCAKKSAAIVGADASEVVVMNTLTVNLQLLMASFYRPTEKRHKIVCEWKPFPSDYYAIESHIQWHGLDPATSIILLHPDDGYLITTESILHTIDEHADSIALLLLPGIQYYTGQLFDIPTITRYAQARNIVVGWDLAHAAGNVPLQLHEWNVDFAVWCTYKYLNAGPGAIAGAFVHARHGKVDYADGQDKPKFRHRLAGWYSGDKKYRFLMDNVLRPTAGAGGFQLSNPSIIDLATLSAALDTFNQTDMSQKREKSLLLTSYAEYLLYQILARDRSSTAPFQIITPKDPLQRGAQLSVLLRKGLLEKVGKAFEREGVVCDQRKPDVIRVAPVPMYNTFEDVWRFMDILEKAIAC
ncbi:kynureninase [Verruconis gallopava]|uniref:Kynureninase n=1 Tax=Verruconis gallopava TaxID=253628 RepID=A0A0D1Z788_9PEZI|nr:kynureninase [Verruconis gallopava]KIW08827.1 kynureninase [Verruconis gallopava]